MKLKEIDVDKIELYGYRIHGDGSITKGRKPLGQSPNTTGYLKVMLDVANTKGTYLVHRLIACKHVPKVDGKLYVNHKDGNRLNNAADNLEWVTSSENMAHAYNVPVGSREAAISLHSSGMTYAAVARELGVSSVSVRNWVLGVNQAEVKKKQREAAKATGRLSYVNGHARIG